MKKIKLIAAMLVIAVVANAQTPTFSWNLGIGSTGGDKLNDMVTNNDNSIVAVGQFSGTVNFDPSGNNTQTSVGSGDIYVAKYNANGSLAWVKTCGGSGQDAAKAVVVDTHKNVYLLGDFTASIDYNPGAAGVHTFTGQTGLTDIILMKYDSIGNFVWAKQIGGSSIDYCSDLGIDDAGNLYATGYFYQTADFNPDTTVTETLTSLGQGDIFLSKYTSDGNFIWVKQIGAPGYQNSNNITISNNSIVLSGSFTSSPDFDPSPAVDSIANPSQYGYIVFFAKYDLNGNYTWAKGIQCNYFATAGEHTVDSNGNIYITGCFCDSTDFDPSSAVFNIWCDPGRRSIYFAKYDANGNFIWAKHMNHPTNTGQDYGYGIALDALNNIYLTGQFYGQGCDFNPSPSDTFLLGSNASNNYDIFIAKYTNTGDYVWAYNIGDATSDEGVKIVFDTENSLIFATNIGNGSFSGQASPIDFDFTTGTSTYTSAGGSDFTITKYTQCYINPSVGLIGNTISAFANNANYQWVNCNIGYLPISSATAQSFTPTVSGSYACIISNSGCSDTTICNSVDLCVGLVNTVSVNSQTMQLNCSVTGATYQWLNCLVGNIAIAGATSQTFTPTTNGSYACKIVINGCTDTSDCATVDKVGIQEFLFNNNVQLFPNPANDFVVIKLDNSKNVSLTLFDANGKIVILNMPLINNQIKINTQDFAKGLYTCKLTSALNGETCIKRFIKE